MEKNTGKVREFCHPRKVGTLVVQYRIYDSGKKTERKTRTNSISKHVPGPRYSFAFSCLEILHVVYRRPSL